MKHAPSNPASFARLLMKAQPRIYAYVRSLVYNTADAEDILQETASVGWEKFDEYDSDRPFDVWMFGIARNQIRYYLQKRKRDILHFNAQTVQILEQAAQNSASDTDRYREALDHCLGRLDEADRDLIHRRYQSGQTNRSVAQMLQVTESKMSRMMNRLYAALMLCMKQYVEGGASE